ncbi:PREDICTED: telomerase reverse transcriptase-like isoform X2 [Trachymyrmex septentrionalis]|uniref:telomerase reverse transcriptase-like isoform X2 n=1 Tax=Trachymyrmex septentrionalis TaxID=34720 RepID=UPI00084F1E3C|nr:PREDICTED: telomerase reverse transcriptase-like isoform X2 [Trachymyrmex septentrionalis]
MIRNCDTLSFTNNYRNRYISYRKRWNKKRRNVCPKSKAVTKVTCPIPLQAYNSRVKLFQSRCKIRKGNRTTAKISKYSILESKDTGQDMCYKILSTDIGLTECYRNVNLNSVIPALSPIMILFKNRHNKYNYFDKLKCIIDKDRKQYPLLKFKHQIHVHSLQSFFGLLVYENVPLELFGTLKNQKVLKKIISRLLKTVPNQILITSAFKRTVRKTVVTGASLVVELLFRKLDISKINWLHSVDDVTIQWIIILKLLHWFFAQYIIKILHKYVVLIAIRKKWVYIIKDDWCNMQNEYIKEKEKSGSLVPYMTSNKKRITGTYKFIPSSSGLRPLYLTKFLQQLYITYFNENGIPTIAGCKHAIRSFLTPRSENHLYFVQCDIKDAFGSILQEKLYNIIHMYCRELEGYIAVQLCTLNKPKKRRNKIYKYTVQIISNHLKKLISKHIDPSIEKPKILKKIWVTSKLYELIFQQKVKLNGQIRSIKAGVPQGLSVSSILSDIYYQHMINDILSEYTNNGLLVKYVDDMLYFTENEHHAAKFLEIIGNGIPEYGVKFNPHKTRTNVGMPCAPVEIKFLRWKVPMFNVGPHKML